MLKIKTNETEIYYEPHGEGFPLIMIPGFTATSQSWKTIAPILEDLSKHYKAIAIDNRGTGRSNAPPGETSIKMMADDAAGLLDALNIPQAHVLGVSMGGMIAQELAINHPEKVKHLILASTSPGGPALDSVKGLREATNKLSWLYAPPPGMTTQLVSSQILKMIFQPRFLMDNMDRIIALFKGETPASTLERHFDAIMRFDAFARLGKIRSKTLVIHGAYDRLFMPECGEILSGSIPGSSLYLCDNASHMVLFEKWSEVRPVILDFLKS